MFQLLWVLRKQIFQRLWEYKKLNLSLLSLYLYMNNTILIGEPLWLI